MPAKSRRAKGDGSIYGRADGRWEGKYTAPDGKRRSVYAPTQAEARTKLRAKLREIEAGGGRGDERRTVAAFLEAWLAAKRATVRPSSWRAYARHVRLHIAPTIGARKLAKLAPEHVRRMLADLLAAGMTPATAGHVLTTLRVALGQAVKDGTLPRNVAALVDKPKAARPRPRGLTTAGAVAILAAVDTDPLAPLVTLSLLTGLRQGEALALQWADVDLDAAVATVRATLQREPGQGLVLAAPKSDAGRRALPLSPLAVEALRRQRAAQGRERMAAGAGWRESGFVFTSARGGPMDGSEVTRRFQALLAAAGLERIRWHDLRGGCLTMLATEGVNVKAAQALAGHSAASLTLDVYTGAPLETVRDAVNRLDSALRREGYGGPA